MSKSDKGCALPGGTVPPGKVVVRHAPGAGPGGLPDRLAPHVPGG
ncbi:hypothetical protein ACU4GD_12650 [Cupriavidus basilensis]